MIKGRLAKFLPIIFDFGDGHLLYGGGCLMCEVSHEC